MKKNEMLEVVNKPFKKIEKLFHKIIINFNPEDILKFRVEIKTLNAFFHLLDMEAKDGSTIRITKKMKTFYGYAGIVRDLKLHLEDVNSYEGSVRTILASYIQKLQKDLEYWEHTAREFMSFDNNFYNDEDNIRAKLPDRLRKISIGKFIGNIVNELQIMVHRHYTDETLINIRKLMEDLHYNWAYLGHGKSSLPQGISKDDDVFKLTQLLSMFANRAIGNTILQTYYKETTNEAEKTLLSNIIETRKMKQQILMQKIRARLQLIKNNTSNVSALKEFQKSW